MLPSSRLNIEPNCSFSTSGVELFAITSSTVNPLWKFFYCCKKFNTTFFETHCMLQSLLSVCMAVPEPSIKRVWPTSLFARSRLRRSVTSQLGTQGRHVCCHTGVVWHEVCKCKLTTICVHSAASPFHDYLRMLVNSNDEMAPFAAQSWLRDHWPHLIRIPGSDISSAPNWIKVKFHTLWHGDSVVKFIMSR